MCCPPIHVKWGQQHVSFLKRQMSRNMVFEPLLRLWAYLSFFVYGHGVGPSHIAKTENCIGTCGIHHPLVSVRTPRPQRLDTKPYWAKLELLLFFLCNPYHNHHQWTIYWFLLLLSTLPMKVQPRWMRQYHILLPFSLNARQAAPNHYQGMNEERNKQVWIGSASFKCYPRWEGINNPFTSHLLP